MGLVKLMFWPLRMLMWPVLAPLHMMHHSFKMVFRFLTVMLLFAQLMVMLFMAAMFVMFTVVPTLMFVLYWIMKKGKHMGRLGKHGKMHMHMPSPRRFKP